MPDTASLQNQLRQWRDYYSTIPGGEQMLYQKVSDYARAQGMSPEMVTQIVQGVAPNPGMWNPSRVSAIMEQSQPVDTGAQYGLEGATSALRQGLSTGTQTIRQGLDAAIPSLMQGRDQALSMLGNTQGQVSGLFNSAQSGLAPFSSAGLKANDLQAALSGALGPEAQKQAFAQYQESPGVDYARSQAEKAITRNASATGNLGGGNVLSELMRNAVGTYLQDFGNQFGRIGQVADRGLSASTTQAGLRGQEAGLQAGLGQYGASIPLQVGQNIADLKTSAYGNIAGMQFGTGNNLGATRYQAGQDLANSVSSTTSALSSLINQEGIGMTEIMGNTTNSLSSLYERASAGDANAMEQLASLLGNISTQNANMVGGQPIIQGQPTNYLGQLGQVTGGIGGLAQGLSYYTTNPATSPVYGPANPRAADIVNPVNYGSYA